MNPSSRTPQWQRTGPALQVLLQSGVPAAGRQPIRQRQEQLNRALLEAARVLGSEQKSPTDAVNRSLACYKALPFLAPAHGERFAFTLNLKFWLRKDPG